MKRSLSRADVGFVVLPVAALALSVVNFIAHASDLLLDQHGFRQTQTAITVYWFLRDGFRLDYQTPVLGAPWSVPFEFPLFQILTALAVRATGLGLDTAGRSVAYVFHLATLWPIWLLGRWLRLPWRYAAAASTLYLCAPLYLFWGKAFMIESLALFLTLLFVALLAHAWTRSDGATRWAEALALSVVGAAAAMVKATTIAPAALLAGALLVGDAWRRWRSRRSVPAAPVSHLVHGHIAVALGVTLGSAYLWTGYADHVKSSNPLTQWLMTDRLVWWQFGTLGDRLSAALWVDTVLKRSLKETFGSGVLPLVGVFAVAALPRRQLLYCFLCILLFLAPFVMFPVLHRIHNYYQYAGAIFAILAAAVLIGALAERHPVVGACVLLLVVALQVRAFASGYATLQGGVAVSQCPALALAGAVKSRIRAGSALIVFGCDWSPELAYYSGRKAVMVPNQDALPLSVASDPARFLGSTPLGAIVVCPRADASREFRAALDLILAGATAEHIAGCDLFGLEPGNGRSGQ